MSSKPLTTAQEQLLAHRPNFAVTTRSPPIGEYIAAIERTCQNMEQGEADEMRAEVKAVVKKSQPHRHNITREEQKALRELKEDNTRVVCTADKGVCMVVLDREEYIKKAEELLNQDSYKIIPADPTTKQKNKLITLLKKIKQEGHIPHTRGCIPQVQAPQNSMACLKYTRQESHSGQVSQAEVQFLMKQPRNWPES